MYGQLEFLHRLAGLDSFDPSRTLYPPVYDVPSVEDVACQYQMSQTSPLSESQIEIRTMIII